MITYNQGDYIEQALESIFTQSVLPDEVIISDDASEDNTFDIIEKYALKYPHIIKAIRQKVNIGVFKNQNFVMFLASGKLITFLAGDDLIKFGLFEELNNVINTNQINLDEKFVIVTNTSLLYPDGTETLIDNYSNKNIPPFYLRLRNSIHYNSVGISRSLIHDCGKIPLDLGYHADLIWNMRIENNSKCHYYTNFISYSYRVGVGVSSKTKYTLLLDSRAKVLNHIKREFANTLSKADLNYIKLEVTYIKYQQIETFKLYFLFVYRYLTNIFNLASNKDFSSVYIFIPKPLVKFIRIFRKR
jgi:glycosyltransferase involved in cell wall biosynthesis